MADDSTMTANAGGPPVGEVWRAPEISGKKYQGVAQGLLNSAGTAFNGWETGNEEFAALLASASRTAAATSPAQSSASHRGVMLFLNVTVVGGAADTLSVKMQAHDPVSDAYGDIADFGVVVTGSDGTGLYIVALTPTADDTDFGGKKALKGSLPYRWKAVVTPSDATPWEYSLGAVGLR